ncbi:toxin-antitoxin system YwqK family antitoxin [Paenibacillus sp. JJ1683]
MENKDELYTLDYIKKNGVDFEDLWFSSTSDEILDNPEDEGGTPFTGLTYELYDNGQLRYFSFYKDGFKHGLLREFYNTGERKSEEIMHYGQTKGKRTQWYENGQLKSVSEHELGVELSYQEWDVKHNLIKSSKLQETSEIYDYLLTQRKQNSKIRRD